VGISIPVRAYAYKGFFFVNKDNALYTFKLYHMKTFMIIVLIFQLLLILLGIYLAITGSLIVGIFIIITNIICGVINLSNYKNFQ
jgi:uncharacterized membrane protein